MADEEARAAEELRALRLENAELRAAATVFGLTWRDRPDEDALPIQFRGVGLTVEPELAVGNYDPDSDPAPHVLIEGDNLHALAALTILHRGLVDLIYIDPPYNTGNTKRSGFTYSDRFRSTEDEERHSAWLSMMHHRLTAARPLLKPEGVILISIDDNEVHHLRVLCDQVFGEQNFIAQLVWDGGTVKNNAKFISGTHEYILVYARSLAAMNDAGVTWREPRPGTQLLIRQYEKLRKAYGDNTDQISRELREWSRTAPISKRLKVFTSVDSRGPYTYADLSAPGGSGASYDVLHPVTGLPCQVPSRGWGCTEERMQQLIDDDRIIFGLDESAQPLRKLYLEDKTDQVRRSILEYPARSSTHLIEHMLGRRGAFNNPKNLDMIADLIRLMSPSDALILDFFAGSGTTGHAVLSLNAEDAGSRRFILVTNNENSICSTVTHPRLEAAITGEWGNEQNVTPLGGSLLKAHTEWLTDEEGEVNYSALAGLAWASTGNEPEMLDENIMLSTSLRGSILTWNGHGKPSVVAKHVKALDKHSRKTGSRTSLILPDHAHYAVEPEATHVVRFPLG